MRTAPHVEPQSALNVAPTPKVPVREYLIAAPVSGVGLAGKRRQLDEQKNIFFAFLTDAWNLPDYTRLVGLQSGFGCASGDQFVLLFDDGPHGFGGSTCLPVSWMLEPADIARVLVAEKISRFEQSFEGKR